MKMIETKKVRINVLVLLFGLVVNLSINAGEFIVFSETLERYENGSNLSGQGGWVGDAHPISSGDGLAGQGKFINGRTPASVPETTSGISATHRKLAERLRTDTIYTLSYDTYSFLGQGVTHNTGVGFYGSTAEAPALGSMFAGVESRLQDEGYNFSLGALGGDIEKFPGLYGIPVTASIVLDPINAVVFGRLEWGVESVETAHWTLDMDRFNEIDGIHLFTDWRGFSNGSYKGAHIDNITLSGDGPVVIQEPQSPEDPQKPPLPIKLPVSDSILVVDRNEANPAADFQTLTQAVGQANPGDTIYVMPSADSYNEEVTITKPLTLVGSGWGRERWFPMAALGESRIAGLNVESSDVFVTGMSVEGVLNVSPSSNVVLFRNNLSTIGEGRAAEAKISNLLIVNNAIEFILFEGRHELVGAVVANNIISGGCRMTRGSGDILHNVIANGRFLSTTKSDPRQRDPLPGGLVGRMYHNIFEITNTPGVAPDKRTVFPSDKMVYDHNLFTSSLPRNSLPGSTPFEQLSVVASAGDVRGAYQLTAESIARGAGANGEDLGIYGGHRPWNPNQQPAIPIITSVDAPRIIGIGEELRVTLEVQTNN